MVLSGTPCPACCFMDFCCAPLRHCAALLNLCVARAADAASLQQRGFTHRSTRAEGVLRWWRWTLTPGCVVVRTRDLKGHWPWTPWWGSCHSGPPGWALSAGSRSHRRCPRQTPAAAAPPCTARRSGKGRPRTEHGERGTWQVMTCSSLSSCSLWECSWGKVVLSCR